MCLCVRYFSTIHQKVQTSFLGIVPVISTTDESLFKAIENFLTKCNIDINNCIGLGTDGANNVSGLHNSVFSRFRNINPNITFIKCTCHSLALCCQKAFAFLPSNLVFLISEISNWFSNSSLRRDEYSTVFMTLNDGNAHYEKFISPSTTRWLVRGKCIQTILVQWEELKSYFSCIVDKSHKAQLLKAMLHDETNKLYLHFACPIIQNFESVNAAFQATNPNLSKLFNDLDELRNFVLQKVYRDFLQRKLPWDLYNDCKLGEKFEYDLKCSSLKLDEKKSIKIHCFNFLTEIIKQVDQRIDNSTMKMKYIKYFDPNVILCQTRPRFNELGIYKLIKQENFTELTVANQYEHILMKTNWRDEFSDCQIPNNPIDFWIYVFNYENAAGEKCYKELATIALDSYCIPVSTAFVERVFSHVTNVKTKARNKIIPENLEALLHIRTNLLTTEKCCTDFKVTQKMLNLFTNQMYNTNTKPNDADEPSTSGTENSEILEETFGLFEEILSVNL